MAHQGAKGGGGGGLAFSRNEYVLIIFFALFQILRKIEHIAPWTKAFFEKGGLHAREKESIL